jgi:hypothetical protein
MKTSLILLSFFIINAAHASYFATHCSNARATVKWETGHNSNSMTIKSSYASGEQDLVVSLGDVKIEMNDKTIIHSHQTSCPNPLASKTEVYSAKVSITPSDKKPDIFGGKVYGNKIETYVICEFHLNSRVFCPQE